MAKKLAKAKNGIPYKSTKTSRDMMEASDIRDRQIAEGKRKPLTAVERISLNTPLDTTYSESLKGKISMQNTPVTALDQVQRMYSKKKK
jgi:hypothetical protein